MNRGRRLAVLLASISVLPAQAGPVAVSPGPEAVSVTIYRDPDRGSDRPMNLGWLNGFALVSETRTVDLPAGDVEIRFEGVAGGILPQSAIVTGFPEGVAEKNQDAWLLSPASLVERSIGRRVHLRRTSRATGAVREHEAVIRSGAGGALVLQTEDGFEALRCSGLSETIVHDRVPEGLSARPTLSVRTQGSRPVRATIVLSYLATGFDWQANYVATLAPSGDRIDLFAWVTLANGDETSFVDAQTQAIAGRLNRQAQRRMPREDGTLHLRCWPQLTTSDIPLEQREEDVVVTGSRITLEGYMSPPPSPPPPPPPPPMMAMQAQQEDLGDVKLYRIPEPVTVAANSQKQVAFLQRSGVEARIVYRHNAASREEWAHAQRVLVTRNRTAEGLGVPLPAGRLILFGSGRERPILLGEGSVRDLSVGEEVEIELGAATGVRAQVVRTGAPNGETVVTVTNDQAVPVRFEMPLPEQRVRSRTRLGRRNGMPLWEVTVPANGRATLRYRPRG